MDHPEWLEDEKFRTRADRTRNGDQIEDEVAVWFAERTTAGAVELLSSHSVPAAPINNVAQAAAEPHLHEREVLTEVPDPIAGKIHVAGKMVKFGRTPMVVGSTPLVGEHTEQILSDVLGYDDARIRGLVNASVVGVASPASED